MAVVDHIAALDAAARVQLTGGCAFGAIVASMLTDAPRTATVGLFCSAMGSWRSRTFKCGRTPS